MEESKDDGWKIVKSSNDKRREKQIERSGDLFDLIQQRYESTRQPVNIRWEAAGDARHPATLLSSLIDSNVQFNAQIHHYEPEDHENSRKAQENLGRIRSRMEKRETGSTLTQSFDQDVTRGSTNSRSQDFILIRNLVGTDEDTKSTSNTNYGVVQGLHRDAMRQRRNSLTGGGEMIVGGSGYPFVDRERNNDDNLGLTTFGPGTLHMPYKESFVDTVGVMKDDGRTLGGREGQRKTTHMHRFGPPAVTNRGGNSGRGRGGSRGRGRGKW